MTPFLSIEARAEEDVDVHTEDDVDEGYQTPTSEDHRIPPTLRCPPAPRKKVTATKRRSSPTATAFKRKRLFGMAEVVSPSEVQEFFWNMEMKKVLEIRRRS
ncbi:hypothetical protein MLD38_038066 [Melastoma candidum]|uniref:Uncharacterized protein n=1 Tax=Melastoma candidum TaxID=119954 RepID=A0ACB9KYC3_9MYRT|nr:hypothetical protein MLD38_038066 [Melastoma candidum]